MQSDSKEFFKIASSWGPNYPFDEAIRTMCERCLPGHAGDTIDSLFVASLTVDCSLRVRLPYKQYSLKPESCELAVTEYTRLYDSFDGSDVDSFCDHMDQHATSVSSLRDTETSQANNLRTLVGQKNQYKCLWEHIEAVTGLAVKPRPELKLPRSDAEYLRLDKRRQMYFNAREWAISGMLQRVPYGMPVKG